MTQYMLLFSLGPVQTFIAQARKTRDLWLGSFLLSALMQASMEGIASQLIFPGNPVIEKNIPDLPNKYIALFDTKQAAVAAAHRSEEHVRSFWLAICEDVWHKTLAEYVSADSPTRQQWKDQVQPEHVFEFFWVAVAGDIEHYQAWLEETQFTFDRRKHLRNFLQREERGEKGTISGTRAALRGEEETRDGIKHFWQYITQKRTTKDINKEGEERLDAIDMVKRFAFYSETCKKRLNLNTLDGLFPSTSSIATASYMEQLLTASEDAQVAAAISAWLDKTHKLGELMPASIPFLRNKVQTNTANTIGTRLLECDGDCFFAETFHEARLKKEFHFTDERRIARKELAEQGPKALKHLLNTIDTLTPAISRPTPYYAMIQMDGDKMGKLINGVQDKEEHQQISNALSVFSRKQVPAIVEGTYPGRLIYAGGDDVFALAPLARDLVSVGSGEDDAIYQSKNVLDLVDQLQRRYREVIQKAVLDPPQLKDGASAPSRKALVTASTGIAIAHHYTSLSYVRRLSKEAEQAAKHQYGRNALVVSVLRRSGAQTQVGCRWHYEGLTDEEQPIPLFLAFYTLFKENILSPKCIYILLEEASTLVALVPDVQKSNEVESVPDAQKSEVKRVLLRQRNSAMKDKFPDEVVKRRAAALVHLAAKMDEISYEKLAKLAKIDEEKRKPLSVELHASEMRYGLVEVLGWLLVMLFLAGKEQE